MITAEQRITQPGKTGARLIIAESRAMREIVNFVQRVAVRRRARFSSKLRTELAKTRWPPHCTIRALGKPALFSR
jgi:hypothetical protein